MYMPGMISGSSTSCTIRKYMPGMISRSSTIRKYMPGMISGSFGIRMYIFEFLNLRLSYGCLRMCFYTSWQKTCKYDVSSSNDYDSKNHIDTLREDPVRISRYIVSGPDISMSFWNHRKKHISARGDPLASAWYGAADACCGDPPCSIRDS